MISQFTVGSGQRVDLLLDFDACHSIVKTGNGDYKLKPVIKVIPFALNGIDGYVDVSLAAGGNVVVSAQTNGNIVRSTVPNPITGKFFLARLDPGHYDVVLTADARATTVISGVPVAGSPNITHVSTSGVRTPSNLSTLIPATRPLTGTVTFDSPSPPPIDDDSVFVVAKQQLNNGPLVTVQSHVASVLTVPVNVDDDYGYSMALPTDSPWLASGSGALPLPLTAFTHQPQSVAGKYAIQASAAGYTTQSANVDIALVTQQDFVLPKIVIP